jgi:Hom_end-associated Hint
MKINIKIILTKMAYTFKKWFDGDISLVTYSGPICKAENLKIGDYLMGEDNLAKKIINITKEEKDSYQVSIKARNGGNISESYNVCSESIMCLRYNTLPKIDFRNEGKYKRYYVKYCCSEKDENGHSKFRTRSKTFNCSGGKEEAEEEAIDFKTEMVHEHGYALHDVSISEYFDINKSNKHRLCIYSSIDIIYPLNFGLEIDPYLFGLWLGDGTSSKPEITNIDPEVIEYMYDYAPTIGCEITNSGNMRYNFGD